MAEVMLEFSTAGLTERDLAGFFVGWPSPPALPERLSIVRAADEVVVARDGDGTVVGFATAITDGRFAAYIPLVEVLPSRQRAGIGSHIVGALLERLGHCYMIDLVCDAGVLPFYERLGGRRLDAVVWRNHDRLGRNVAESR